VLAGIPVLVGVMPPRSTAALEHMHKNIPGVEVDDATFARLRGRSGEDAKAAGVAVGAEVIEQLRKIPGVAETLDWAATLAGLDLHDLRQEPEVVHETMMCLLKTREDRSRLTREVTERLLGKVA